MKLKVSYNRQSIILIFNNFIKLLICLIKLISIFSIPYFSKYFNNLFLHIDKSYAFLIIY